MKTYSKKELIKILKTEREREKHGKQRNSLDAVCASDNDYCQPIKRGLFVCEVMYIIGDIEENDIYGKWNLYALCPYETFRLATTQREFIYDPDKKQLSYITEEGGHKHIIAKHIRLWIAKAIVACLITFKYRKELL